MADNDFLVTVSDIPAAEVCWPGVRKFYRRHGLDMRKLLNEGTPAQELIDTGDAMALRFVEVARGRKQ